MVSQSKSAARTRAEERFDKARQTNDAAQALIDQELAAVRAKTARLKAARLAKEAKEGAPEPGSEKPAAKKRKTTKR